MTMPWVLLRCAVEGIASPRRRLAPRNDNQGTRGKEDKKGRGVPRPYGEDGQIRYYVPHPVIARSAARHDVAIPSEIGNNPALFFTRFPFAPRLSRCHCEEPRRHDVANPLGNPLDYLAFALRRCLLMLPGRCYRQRSVRRRFQLRNHCRTWRPWSCPPCAHRQPAPPRLP